MTDTSSEGQTPATTGPFLPVTESDIDVFNDILSEDIDSAYASSICCCDHCYEDFSEKWPDIPFREDSFQTQSLGVHLLVENSRLPGIYSPTEISTLRNFVRCNRCFNFAPYNVWIYEHRFSEASEIEDAVNEVSVIGVQTPFLLLEHEFARRVLDQIRLQAKTQSYTIVDFPLFRARTTASIEENNQSYSCITTYGPPPASNVTEGRFNHAGSPMLYLSNKPSVAIAELGKGKKPCYVAEFTVKDRFKILDLVDIKEEKDGYDLMKALASSALLAAPRTEEGWQQRQYVFSRFVAWSTPNLESRI